MLKITNEIKLEPQILNSLLEQVENTDEEDNQVIFDFSETKWIDSELTVFLGSLVIFLISKGHEINFTPMKQSLESLFLRNGFFETHGLGEKKEDVNNTIIPYRIFPSAAYEQIDYYLSKDVFGKITEHVKGESLEIVANCIFEIVHNIKEHSGSKEVLICGQWYPTKGKLALAIADVGMSIPKKINNYFKTVGKKQQPDWWAINWATEKGNSTKAILDGGLGLYELKNSFMDHGQLKILSNNALLLYNKEEAYYSELDYSFPGTLLHLEFEIK